MIPTQLLLLPYITGGRLTPHEADKVHPILQEKLYGQPTDQSLMYLTMVIEECIKEANAK